MASSGGKSLAVGHISGFQIDPKRIEKYRNTIHDKVYTTYTAFEADGEKYVQIDTYGRIGRENLEKISQSFQFDRATAEFLVNLLREEFDIR